jgi:tryptophan 2,3-dioxygenase
MNATVLVHTWSLSGGAGEFPVAAATGELRRHGMSCASAEFVSALVAATTVAARVASRAPHLSWAVRSWLENATACVTGRRSYSAYTMSDVFDEYCAAGEDYQSRARTVSAALLADTLSCELRTRPEVRGTAALSLAADLHATLGHVSRGGRLPAGEAAGRCADLVADLCAGEPALAVLIPCTPLPVTTEPDEPLFIRTVQVTELLARDCARQAEQALHLGERRLPELLARLTAIATNLRWASRLFPLLNTMDRDGFARIRAATTGTGALQSSGFAALERVCRGAEAVRPETVHAFPAERAPIPKTSLAVRLAGLRTGHTGPLEAAIGDVDTAWLRWKRAHRGATRRLIGDVPGTGGTEGLRYLDTQVHSPLLGRPVRGEP